MEWWNYPEEAWDSENLIFVNWSWTRVAQWWEHSPATNVVIRIVLMAYVDWLCCWFSPLLREVFLRVLRFSPLLKNQHFQIPIQSGMHRHVSTSSWELLIAPWVNKLQWQYKSHEHSLSWLKMEIGLLALTRLWFSTEFLHSQCHKHMAINLPLLTQTSHQITDYIRVKTWDR